MKYLEKDIQTELCNHCGESVAFGSGKFVNRIFDLNDIQTRIANNRINPKGDFVCEECDNNSEIHNNQ